MILLILQQARLAKTLGENGVCWTSG